MTGRTAALMTASTRAARSRVPVVDTRIPETSAVAT